MGKNARTFGQDLMRGEHVVGAPKGLAIGTTAWVQDKIAAGDIEGGMSAGQTGTSIFDPVLCELVYRWFSPPGGVVLDPFAGGSVRGIVASRLGRTYLGCELRPEQVAANRDQAETICRGFPIPQWIEGDSAETIPGIDAAADLVFSCPPYGDLEIYSDLEADLSAMPHAAFVDSYRRIVAAAIGKLRQDRFACFVVGDFRDKRGLYRDFVSETVRAFKLAGADLYNEIILVTAAGSLPIRAAKQFSASRKVGKTHQNVLVFVKGDPVRATKACGKVQIDKSLFASLETESAAPGDGADDDEDENAAAG